VSRLNVDRSSYVNLLCNCNSRRASLAFEINLISVATLHILSTYAFSYSAIISPSGKGSGWVTMSVGRIGISPVMVVNGAKPWLLAALNLIAINIEGT
jgi:hypothetical protein